MIAYPRSLRGRTLMLTIVGILACEFVTFAVLGAYRHALLAGRAHDFVNGQIEMVRSALNHATPDQVARELDRPEFRRQFPERRDPSPPGSPDADSFAQNSEPPPSPPRGRDRSMRDPLFGWMGHHAGQSARSLARMRLVQGLAARATTEVPSEMASSQVVSALRDEYGAEALRFTAQPESAVWVRMSTDGWWLVLPFSRYSAPPIPWPIVLATLAAVAVMGGLVALYSFHLSKPLRALADAAANYKIGQHPALPLTGPDEIRAVTGQFNAMAERLERDDAERRVMLASLPHDLRAPLSRAKLRLELMNDSPDSPKQGLARDLTEVARIADQFVAYLRGLDRDTRNFKDTALNEIVRNRGLVWRESGHDIAIERADVFHRAADGDALMRAIDNLISNAFAHGAAPVTIAGEASGTGPQARYRIVVRDHGPGIAPERRVEALKPFTRLDAARGASGHCGLGLAVAQSVARLHDGRIELDEAAGGGLDAAIVLPAASTST